MIDVIIPVYCPDDKLEKLIRRLNQQTKKANQILFLQTMTGTDEDERVEKILSQADNGTIIPVKKEAFDHGGTRNMGARMSQAEFILFLTQDAVPVDEYLIEKLYHAISSDKGIATAYGRQIADEQVGFIERYTRMFNYPEESSVKGKQDLERLGIKTYFCSNVCAMYRRKVYEELGGFVTKTIFNEDMIFASRVISADYQIAYVADAQVVHAHKYTYREQFTRNFDMAVSQRQYREIFENIKSESEGIRMVKNTARFLLKQGKWYLLPDLVFQSGFKYMGYTMGLRYQKLPLSLVKKFSMNKRYWDEKNG